MYGIRVDQIPEIIEVPTNSLLDVAARLLKMEDITSFCYNFNGKTIIRRGTIEIKNETLGFTVHPIIK